MNNNTIYINKKMAFKECRECNTICKLDQIIYRIFPKKTHYIETSICWVLGKDVCDGKAKIDSDDSRDLWMYCYDCYIKFSLSLKKNLCSNCGCYDTYSGVPPSLTKDSFFVSGNGAIGSFSFPINKKPEHLNTNGFLCMSCIQHFVIDGTLIAEKKYTDKLNDSLLLAHNKPLCCLPKNCNLCDKECKNTCYFDDCSSDSDLDCEQSCNYKNIYEQESRSNNKPNDQQCDDSSYKYIFNDSIVNSDIHTSDNKTKNIDTKTESIDILNYNSDDDNYANSYNILINEDKICDLSGTYQIKTDDENIKIKMKVLEYPATICNNCADLFVKNYTDKQSICNLCSDHSWSGAKCFLHDNGVCCGYGSSHDMKEYRWRSGGKPKNLKNIENICDTCLEYLINRGCLIYNGEYM